MNTTENNQPPKGLSQWKTRLKEELKPPFSFEQMRWELPDLFSLDALYGPDSPENAELGYLKGFHEQWKNTWPSKRASISVGTHAMVKNPNPDWKTAEGYGFQTWFGPQPQTQLSLPFFPEPAPSNLDPVGFALQNGNMEISGISSESKVVPIQGQIIQEAGGNPVQELAYLLLVSDYYKKFSHEHIEINWQMGIGPQFWLELAKCRAARLLWMNFADFNEQNRGGFTLTGKTSSLFWSPKDIDMNLIRHATETMSALLGGVDEIRILPHTLNPDKALESTRLAANIALICFEESNLDSFVDPASGSHWVEMATDKLATHAWNQFLTWEETGLEQLLSTGQLANEIQMSGNKLKEAYRTGNQVWIGENAYSNVLSESSTFNLKEKQYFNSASSLVQIHLS